MLTAFIYTIHEVSAMDQAVRQAMAAAIGQIPSGVFLLTAKHEDRMRGMLASWVQQVSFQPPMVSVAVAKGRTIMPLISESRRFGLCQLPETDKIIGRKFADASNSSDDDPFLGMEMIRDTKLFVPILANVAAYMECEVSYHIDLEADHDLFVGRVLQGRVVNGKPQIRMRENGFEY